MNNYIIKGNIFDKLSSIIGIIDSIIEMDNYTQFYIGATHNGSERLKKYENWSRKEIIYETGSITSAIYAEEELIKFLKNKKNSKNINCCNLIDESIYLKNDQGIYQVYLFADF